MHCSSLQRFEASSLVDGLTSYDSDKVSSTPQLMNGNHQFDSTSDLVPIQKTSGHVDQKTQQVGRFKDGGTKSVCLKDV